MISGIPPIHKQKQRVELEQIVRCTPNIWEKVREKLRTVSILNAIPDTTERVYKALLEKSESPHNIVAEDNIVRLASARSQTDEFALFFQVTRIISDLRTQHWRAEDIGVLFSTLNDAEFFMEQYNNGKPARETLVSCTDDTRSKNCVCDSVRRFAGLDKPCIVLVEPAVIHWSHDKNAFEALAMSRAMVKLVIIEK